MNSVETIFLLIFLAGLLSVIANYTRIAHEILLVIGGCFIGFIPGVNGFTADPDIIFFLFLPPLLSYAAYYFSWREFKVYFYSISMLAFGAVLFTMTSVAVTLKLLIPEVPWAIGFLLGAVVSPPDASAVTAIVKNLKVPEKMVTLLEGESLINDATALVAFRFAIGAVLSGVFSFWDALGKFGLVSLGGLVIGLGVAYASIRIRRKYRDTSLDIVISFLTPFFAYILAEKFHFSGVIATVSGSLYISRMNPFVSTPLSRRKSFAVWEMLIFLINSLAFLLIGLQLPKIMDTAWFHEPRQLFYQVSIISLVVIASRFIWIFTSIYIPKLAQSFYKKRPIPSFKEEAISSWAGMRGIVSLAAAMTIPMSMESGEPFPNRELIIFFTYGVVLVTLVFPGLSLPWLIQKLNLPEENTHHQEELDARIACAEAALIYLQKQEFQSAIGMEYLDVIRQGYLNRIHSFSKRWLSPEEENNLKMEEEVKKLKLKLLQQERNLLLNLRSKELIHDSVMLKIQSELDIKEISLRSK
jgi:monovalent cation/hydrogen antiporter